MFSIRKFWQNLLRNNRIHNLEVAQQELALEVAKLENSSSAISQYIERLEGLNTSTALPDETRKVAQEMIAYLNGVRSRIRETLIVRRHVYQMSVLLLNLYSTFPEDIEIDIGLIDQAFDRAMNDVRVSLESPKG